MELLSDTVASKHIFTPDSPVELAEKLVELCSLSADEVRVLSLKLRKGILTKLNPSRVEGKIFESLHNM